MRRGAGNISEIVLCLFYFLTQKFGKNLNSKFFILKKEKNKNFDVQIRYILQNHHTFCWEKRLVNLVRRREGFVGLPSN